MSGILKTGGEKEGEWSKEIYWNGGVELEEKKRKKKWWKID